MSVPRGIRNNNPGNIVKSAVAWQGKVAGTDPVFETFDTPHNGIRALAKQLIVNQDSHGLTTVRGQISRWSPPHENDTAAYIAIIAKALGVTQDTPINVHSLETMRRLVTAIISHENGQQPYPSALIGAAIGDALGIVPKDEPVVTQRLPMDPLTLLSVFGPILGQLIPQISKIVGGGEKAQQNVALAQTVLDTVVKASGAPNVQGAIEAMQADPAVTRKVTEAVVAEPTISFYIAEGGGGGVAGARDFASANANNPKMVTTLQVVSYWALAFLTFANVAGFALSGAIIYKNGTEWQQIVSTLIQADIAAAMIALGFWLGATLAKSGPSTPIGSK